MQVLPITAEALAGRFTLGVNFHLANMIESLPKINNFGLRHLNVGTIYKLEYKKCNLGHL